MGFNYIELNNDYSKLCYVLVNKLLVFAVVIWR